MPSWEIAGRFVIDAESEAEADAALRAIERTAARVNACVTIHVHASDEQAGLD